MRGWGIVSAVGISAIAGYALVAALTLAVKDLSEAAKDAQPALYILRASFGERAGNAAMGLAIVAMWFCGLSSVTSASRTLYAFARDGGPPGSMALRKVSAAYKTPVAAILVAVVMPLLLVLVTSPFSDAVFLAVASLATTGLYVSYATPIALGAIARRRGVWRHRGPWNLGAWGGLVAWLAVAWSLSVLVICCLPPNGTAGLLLGGVASAIVVLYFLVARGKFAGPKVTMASAFQDSPEPTRR